MNSDSDLWDNNQRSNIYVIKVPEGDKEKETQMLLSDIYQKCFQIWQKKNKPINSRKYVNHSRINPKKPHQNTAYSSF
jgi:hypothetical protein